VAGACSGRVCWSPIQTRFPRAFASLSLPSQNNTVLIIANRKLLSGKTWARSDKYTGVRPRSRTLQQVQSAILDDICYPSEITGKRLRVRTDGGRVLKVILSHKDQHAVADRTDVLRAVYKKLTDKDVTFEFTVPWVPLPLPSRNTLPPCHHERPGRNNTPPAPSAPPLP
jgi:hypothetical protein